MFILKDGAPCSSCQCTERFALLATKWQAEAHLAEALVSTSVMHNDRDTGHVDVGVWRGRARPAEAQPCAAATNRRGCVTAARSQQIYIGRSVNDPSGVQVAMGHRYSSRQCSLKRCGSTRVAREEWGLRPGGDGSRELQSLGTPAGPSRMQGLRPQSRLSPFLIAPGPSRQAYTSPDGQFAHIRAACATTASHLGCGLGTPTWQAVTRQPVNALLPASRPSTRLITGAMRTSPPQVIERILTDGCMSLNLRTDCVRARQ